MLLAIYFMLAGTKKKKKKHSIYECSRVLAEHLKSGLFEHHKGTLGTRSFRHAKRQECLE